MNTTRLAIALGLATLAASAGFLACSSDDTALPDVDASTDARTNDTGSSRPDTGGGGGSDAGTDSGPVSDPGIVSCGVATCGVPAQFCCIQSDGGAGGSQTCNDAGGGAGNCANGTRVACDEAADCADSGGTAQFCCVRVPGGLGGNQSGNTCQTAFQCRFGGGGSGKAACKFDSDCADAGADASTCVAQDCRGRTLRTCGGFQADDAGVPLGCQ